MKPPLIVGLLHDERARAAVRGIDCEFSEVSSLPGLHAGGLPRPPRLFVLEVAAGQTEDTRTTVVRLRRAWPLTDVVLWAPQASGATVRSLFLVGAQDVVVSRSLSNLLGAIEEVVTQQQILPRVDGLSRLRNRSSRFESMISRSDAMWDLFDLCTRTAQTDATVLILGETGTGKELIARAIHRRSGRGGRFVAANCSSVPPELVNSELFGHEKGAFTGADRAKKGLVRHAHEGTLFLDEIGDMPPEGQQSLLRMLQEMKIRPVGSLVETPVNVRVVAATHVPLEEAVRTGDFREDLFYRLDVIRMNVPTLRERPEDILFLFGHFAKQSAKHYGLAPPTWSDGFLDALTDYAWPGNVRQLENFCERLILSRPQRALTARDFVKLRSTGLTERGRTLLPPSAPGRRSKADVSRTLQDCLDAAAAQIEVDYLQTILQQNGGRIADSARQAGISRRTLLRKLNRHEIDKQDFRDA